MIKKWKRKSFLDINVPKTGEFIKFSCAWKNYNANFCITQNGQFLGLLQQSTAPFRERYLPATGVLNLLNLYLYSSHFFTLQKQLSTLRNDEIMWRTGVEWGVINIVDAFDLSRFGGNFYLLWLSMCRKQPKNGNWNYLFMEAY